MSAPIFGTGNPGITVDRNPNEPDLTLHQTVRVCENVVNALYMYADKVAQIVAIHKIPRGESSLYVYVVQFNSITPDAQGTLTNLMQKAFGKMPYILPLAGPAQLLIVKGCQLDRCDKPISDITYVMQQRSKRSPASGDMPPAKRRHVMSPVFQLGSLASSAQLSCARAEGEGASDAARRPDVVDLTGADEWYIDLTTEDESRAVADVPSPIVSAPATIPQVIAPLVVVSAPTLPPTREANNAQQTQVSDKQLEKQQKKAEKVAKRAAFLAKRKVLSVLNRKKNVERKKMEREQEKQESVGTAAGTPGTTSQDAAVATQDESDVAAILQNMSGVLAGANDVGDAAHILQSMRCADVIDESEAKVE